MIEYTYEELSKMSTEELEELLSDTDGMDDDMLLYILQLIEDSGKYDSEFTDTETARKEFINTYYKNHKTKFTDKGAYRWVKAACIVFVMIFVFGLGVVTAEATGWSYSRKEFMYTDDEFSILRPEANNLRMLIFAKGDDYTVPELEHVQEILLKGAVDYDVLVSWIPEGYTVIDTGGYAGRNQVNLEVVLSNGKNEITLRFVDFWAQGNVYKKDEGKISIYETSGMKHYIMTNDEKWQAVWTNAHTECSISGVESKEELTKMIDSIYEIHVD